MNKIKDILSASAKGWRRLAGKLSRRTAPAAAMAAAVSCAAVFLPSCVKNETAGAGMDGDERREICFNIIPVKTGTKAATFTTFPADSAFGTTAWFLPSGKSWRDNSADAVEWVGEEKITCGENSVWKAWESGNVYWWPHGGTLTFFSWAPYRLREYSGFSLSKEDGGIAIKNWSVKATPGYGGATDHGSATKPADGSVDILTARSLDLSGSTQNSYPTAEGGTFTGNGAKVQFTHALCKVRFLISLDYAPEDESQKWYVEKVELKDIYTQGTFKGTVWSDYPLSSMADYSLSFTGDDTPDGMEITDDEQKTLIPRTMMMPQPLTAASYGTVTRVPRIELDIWNGGYDSMHNKDVLHLSGLLYSNHTEILRWSEGSDIVYHLFVSTGKENYIDFDASTEAWDSVDGGDIDLH